MSSTKQLCIAGMGKESCASLSPHPYPSPRGSQFQFTCPESNCLKQRVHSTAFDSSVSFFEGRIDRNRPDLHSLDVVTLWHVFEHLYDPKKALEHIAEMLRPGGYLLIAVPEPACLERRVFGRYWIGWDPPRHVATYSQKSIGTFFRQAGLQMVAAPPDICNGAMLAMNFGHVLRGVGVQARLQG